MAVQRIGIEDFIKLADSLPMLDVRSPGEYNHAHFPGAFTMPLFTDEERKIVGTTYKQRDRQQAIKIGLDYFGPKMRKIVEDVEAILRDYKPAKGTESKSNTVLVHCWRGGMRSGAVAWLLDLYGFKVYTLAGGYKAFRNWVLQQFEKPYTLSILGGYTGSGKTDILKELSKRRHTIDLEGIAHHKGSAFGALGEEKQPSSEQFENILALELSKIPAGENIWLEDESRRIGEINLPLALWNTMRSSPVYFLDIPFEERLDYITAGYGKHQQEDLVNAILRVQKRLGGLNTKNAIGFLLEKNIKESFRILLAYYDKYYGGSLHTRENLDQLLTVIKCDKVDAKNNAIRVINAQVNAMP